MAPGSIMQIADTHWHLMHILTSKTSPALLAPLPFPHRFDIFSTEAKNTELSHALRTMKNTLLGFIPDSTTAKKGKRVYIYIKKKTFILTNIKGLNYNTSSGCLPCLQWWIATRQQQWRQTEQQKRQRQKISEEEEEDSKRYTKKEDRKALLKGLKEQGTL